VNVNFGTGTGFGIRVSRAQADIEASSTTIEMPADWRQRFHAIGDDHLNAALEVGRQRRAVAGDLQLEAGAEAFG
jgi:hypothetical protein